MDAEREPRAQREARLDAKDRAIIDALRENGEMRLADIGKRVGLKASQVSDRKNRLIEDGVIKIQAVIQKDRQLNHSARYIFIRNITVTSKMKSLLLRFCLAHDEITHADIVTGDVDVIIYMESQDIDKFEYLRTKLTDLLSSFYKKKSHETDDVFKITSYVVSVVIKDTIPKAISAY